MKIKSTLTLFTLLATTFLLINSSSGPGSVQDMDRTGSPLSSGACNVTGCHDAGTFNPSVAIELLKNNQAVSQYQPGESYDMKVTITAGQGTPAAYGFQAVALTGTNNDNTGSWGSPPAGMQSITISNGRTYVEHSTPNSGSNSFMVEWTAPQAGTGDVTFYAAGNAVNLDNDRTGDGAKTIQVTLTEEDPNNTSTTEQLSDLSIFPNPVQDVLIIKINSRVSGKYDLRITDVNGKTIQLDRLELNEGQNEKNINVGDLAKGLYLLHLVGEKEVATQTLLKM